MENKPPTARQESQRAAMHRGMQKWLVFLFIVTPVYGLIAWLVLAPKINVFHMDQSDFFLSRIVVILIYIILVISTYSSARPYFQIKAFPKDDDLIGIRQRDSFVTDEIDQLIRSIRTMLKNLSAQQAELIESREKMQELARTTLRLQEAERRFVSRELHDQAGQLLVSLRYTVESLLSDLSPDQPKQTKSTPTVDALTARLSGMLVQIDKTLGTIRALSHKMRPALLDVGDINLAMQEYCTEFQQGKKINITYEGASLPYVTDEIAISLFRFLQEALTNVLKHADASQVQVRLSQEDGWIEMSVADNGRGETAGSGPKGIGIVGMRERFQLLNGIVEAHPTKSGFTITVRVPLEETNLSEAVL